MSFQCKVKAGELAAALCRGAWVTETKTFPILGNVKLAAQGDSLEIIATDNDIESVVTLAATEGSGATTVSARTFAAVLKTIAKDSDVDLSESEGKLLIRSAELDMALPTLPAEDFPQFLRGSVTDCVMRIDIAAFRRGIDAVAFAMSGEETRYYLNGVHLCANPVTGTARLVATDGHRLATFDFSDGVELAAGEIPQNVILPRKLIAGVRRIINGKVHGTAILKFRTGAAQGDRVTIELPGIDLFAKLVDGTFPDYQRVMPSTYQHEREVNRARFLGAVKRALALGVGQSMAALRIASEESGLVITCILHDGETITERVPFTIAPKAPGGFLFGASPRYLAEHLEAIDGDDLVLMVNDAAGPFGIRAAGDGAHTIIQMPMHL